MSWTREQLERRFPGIAWAEPIRILIAGRGVTYACRVCIADHGLRAIDAPMLTFEEVAAHIRAEHG